MARTADIGLRGVLAPPSSPYTVRFAEKSIFWMRFLIRTPGVHSAYPHMSKSASKIAARLILDLESGRRSRDRTRTVAARSP